MPLTLMFFMVVGMVTVTAVGVNQTSDSMAFRGVQKTQATQLAESGVHALYDQVVRELAANRTPASSLPSSVLSAEFTGSDRVLGRYEARIVDVKSERVAPAPAYGGTSVQYTYTMEVEGKGTAPNRTESVVRASFRVRKVLRRESGGSPSASYNDFPGAINSNSVVDIVTNQGVRTYDVAAEDKEAHIVANEGITWRPAWGSKEAFANPNIIDVQGHLLVANQPTPAWYEMTKGVSGLGNPNGRKNYRSAGPWLRQVTPYTVVENEVTGMGQPKAHPSPDEVADLVDSWRTSAESALRTSRFGAGLDTRGLLFHPRTGRKQVTAPAFVTGTLRVRSGDQLLLVPGSSTDPAQNVVFVTGDVLNEGEIVNLGVKLVVVGRYSDGASSVYRVDQQGSAFDTLQEVYEQASLVSLAPTTHAIHLSTNSSGRYGNVYAPNGGITVTGSFEMNGVLVSGGPRPERLPTPPSGDGSVRGGGLGQPHWTQGGGVYIWPRGGNSFGLHYVREATSVSMPRGDSGNTSVFHEPVRADRLANWRQLK